MINVNELTKEAYKSDSIDKQLTINFPSKGIVYTNDDVYNQNFELEECLEENKILSFKGCSSSRVSIELIGVTTDLRGEYFEVSITAEDTETIPLFKGYVDSQSNLNFSDESTQIVGYDVLYQKFDMECGRWYDSLTFPLSVRQFRNSFFNYIGITQKDEVLPNDSLMMQKMVSDSSIKASYIMQCICQANARYGRISRVDGKFEYVKLEPASSALGTYPSQTTYPSNETYPAKPIDVEPVSTGILKSASHSPYDIEKITKVVVLDEAEIMKGEYGQNDNNILKIVGNMVAYSVNLNVCAQHIYEEVKNITLTPANVELRGLPYVECGDVYVTFSGKDVITSYVLERTLTGIVGIMDKFTSEIEQYQKEDNSLSNQLLRLNHATNILTRTVDETKSELTNYERTTDGTLEEMSSSITQTAEDITSEVKRASDAEGELSSKITQTANSIKSEVTRATEAEDDLSSSIEQTAEAVTSKVSKGAVSSEISQEAGQITIKSNRISITSTYFTLTTEGKIKATDGEFSGEITANEGYIGGSSGFTIKSKAIYNGVSTMSDFGSGVYVGTDGIKVGFDSSHGFKVTSSGAVEIKPKSGSNFKIGDNYGFQVDYNSNLQIGGTSGFHASMTEFSIGTSKTFRVYSSGQICKVGAIEINGSAGKYTITGAVSIELVGGTTSIITGSRTGIQIAKGGPGVVVGSSSSRLYFFGSSSTQGSTRQFVAKASSSATLATLITKLNDLITALAKYNLISTN